VDERVATVTFTAGTLSKTVAVTQESAVATLVVSPAAIDAVANAGSYTITITSNAPWTAAANADWLTLAPAAGEGNGTIAVSVAANLVQETRTATITVAAGTLTQTVTVTQAAAATSDTPPHAASGQVWTIGNQTWSDVIHIPECNKDGNFEENGTDPICRSYTHQGTTWYYYNQHYVNQMAGDLCPAPWRVPTKDDFIALDVAMGGDGENRNGVTPDWIAAKYVNEWGGTFGGFADGSGIGSAGADANYWSSSEYDATLGYALNFTPSDYVLPQVAYYKSYGFLVRCIK
jgi:uncharacterized protein (TIGR02145 family)